MEATDQGATTDSHVEGNLVVEFGEEFNTWSTILLQLIIPLIFRWKVMLVHQIGFSISHLIIPRGQNMALMLLFGELIQVKLFPNLGLLDPLLLILLGILHGMRKCLECSIQLLTIYMTFNRALRTSLLHLFLIEHTCQIFYPVFRKQPLIDTTHFHRLKQFLV